MTHPLQRVITTWFGYYNVVNKYRKLIKIITFKLINNELIIDEVWATMKNQQFALLICVFTLLACIGISFPAEIGSGSGSGSDDDLEEEAICLSVASGHENNFTTNSTKAVLQARCTSACISQVSII